MRASFGLRAFVYDLRCWIRESQCWPRESQCWPRARRWPALLLATVLVGVSGIGSAQAPTVDCSTPRRAVNTWLGNLQSDHDEPEDAATCFDWSGAGITERHRKHRLARQLQAVFDQRGYMVDPDSIPDVAEPGDDVTEDGKVRPHARMPEIYLVRDGEEWLISAHSIATIDGLHADTFSVDVESMVESFPGWMRAMPVPGVAVWQLLGILAALLLGMLVRLLLARILSSQIARVLKRRQQKWDPEVLRRTANPLGTLAMAGVLWWALPLLRFGVRVNQIGTIAIRVIAASAAVLVLYRLVDFGADIFAKRAEKTESKFDDQIVPLIRKTLKVFVAVVGIIFVLQNLDVDVGSLLAGVSLGGLAFTLAAKDTVANLFGSVSIFADQPFQIGDWVTVDGHEGIIEEVGMRSTRIRTFYDSLITVPNSIVANAAIDNYGHRKYRRCMVTLGLTYDTSPDQMQAFVEGVRAILQANPKVRQDSYEVHFRNFGESALEVLLYFFFEVPSWTEELAQRQNVFLEIMRLADRIGVSFAFPTQTLHIEAMAKPGAAPAPARPSREELKKIVEGFGPDGGHATAESEPLTSGYWPSSVNTEDRGGS